MQQWWQGFLTTPATKKMHLKYRLLKSSAAYICLLQELISAYRQTVWTLIRLLLQEQSDHGPHCLIQGRLKRNSRRHRADDIWHLVAISSRRISILLLKISCQSNQVITQVHTRIRKNQSFCSLHLKIKCQNRIKLAAYLLSYRCIQKYTNLQAVYYTVQR